MASKREQIKLQSNKSTHRRYTYKNKTSTPGRLVLKKYDPIVREPAEYKEVK
jgi:large subunit ribosomal protein L33